MSITKGVNLYINPEIIRRVIKKARQSSCRFRISAIGISNKGEVLATTTNKQRFVRKGGGIHAEHAIIRLCSKALKTIIICRIGNGGAILPIHPCPTCARMAAEHNVKIVTVTDFL